MEKWRWNEWRIDEIEKVKDERKKKKIWKTDSHISLGSTYMKFRKIPSTNYTDPIMIPFLHYKRHKHFNYFLKKKKRFLSFVWMIISRCISRNRRRIRWDQSYRLLDRFYHRFERERVHRIFIKDILIPSRLE